MKGLGWVYLCLPTALMSTAKFNIAMVSDYCYPRTGGIEIHIMCLSKELISRGNHVIIITHKSDGYTGYNIINNIPVYFLDVPVMCMDTSFPSLFANFFVFKKIFDKEKIQVVHGHQTMSNLCLEGLFHASTLNLMTIITDHSVFEVGIFENILCNAMCRFILKFVDKGICVSYTSKINTYERTKIPLNKIHVIPNAMVPEVFYPKTNVKKDHVVLLAMSRLVFRKGIDLLVDALNVICTLDTKIQIIIAGDGPKRDDLEQKIDECSLGERVKLVGLIRPEEVADFLRQGDIFLNTSLTETFCMAILEAASCGLHVVSTNVGGIHEVLPSDMITYCKLSSEDVAKKVIEAKNKLAHYNPQDMHDRLKGIYNWKHVAKLTEEVYVDIKKEQITLYERLDGYSGFSGFLCRMAVVIEYIVLWIICKFTDE